MSFSKLQQLLVSMNSTRHEHRVMQIKAFEITMDLETANMLDGNFKSASYLHQQFLGDGTGPEFSCFNLKGKKLTKLQQTIFHLSQVLLSSIVFTSDINTTSWNSIIKFIVVLYQHDCHNSNFNRPHCFQILGSARYIFYYTSIVTIFKTQASDFKLGS